MTVSYRTGIAILQFIFFLPSLFLGLYLCFRPGKRAISTWRTVTTLSALRVAGDISYFISLSKPSVNVYVAVVVCELVGIAPLMLTLVAFVGRVNRNTCTIPQKAFHLISALSLTGLILGIVGTNDALHDATSTTDVPINGIMKTALALFLAGYGIIMIFFAWVALDVQRHHAKRLALGTEARLLIFVGLGSPFVFVRLLYAALFDYTGNQLYSPIDGNNTVYLCMCVLMEIIAAAICFASAYFVPMPEAQPVDGGDESQDSSAYRALSSRTKRTSHDLEDVAPTAGHA